MLCRVTAVSAIALLASLLDPVLAQVHTDCNPLQKTCPPNPAFGMSHNFNFNVTPKAETWETTVGPVKYTPQNGVEFTINKQGDSPTIRTKFYFFFGRTEIWIKAAKGVGIISSMMWLSDDLDEVDWEFLGVNNTYALSNYFGKGIEDFTNGASHRVPGAGVSDDFHNYTTLWTKDVLQWYIDGQLVRTLLPKDANNTFQYPQTPMRLSLGIWAGGDPRMAAGTREWAGGDTDYNAGPYTMYVKSAHVSDFSSGKQYVYGDNSGTWQSIKVVEGNSTVKDVILAVPEKSIGEKFEALPQTAKIAIYASGAAVVAAFVFGGLWYCIKQRRRGAREAKIAEAKAEEERLELERFKKNGIDPDSFASSATEYNAKEMNKDGMIQGDAYSVPPSPLTPGAAGQGNRFNEKGWEPAPLSAGPGAAAAAAGGMRSPVPLLREDAQSPRMASPGPLQPYRDGNMRPYGAGPALSPLRTPSPGMPPSFPPPASPAHRSATSPNAYMRMGSPGPQQGYGAPRMHSPAPLAPQNRSFSAPRPQPGYGNGGGYRGADSDQGYWDNGGGYR